MSVLPQHPTANGQSPKGLFMTSTAESMNCNHEQNKCMISLILSKCMSSVLLVSTVDLNKMYPFIYERQGIDHIKHTVGGEHIFAIGYMEHQDNILAQRKLLLLGILPTKLKK